MNKIFLFFALFVFTTIFAQVPGDIAQSFGEYPGFNNSVFAIQQQTDGKILVGGAFTSYKGAAENYIIRLNSDGSKDTSFNTGTGFNGSVYSIQQQTDGKILIGGNFTSYKGVAAYRIIRLNTDGSKDTSFNTGTGFNYTVYTIQQQTDGKILVGGAFTSYKGVAAYKIIRLNTDGSKDTSFNTGTGFMNYYVRTIAIQLDGKILVGGNFTSYKGVAEKYIIRLNADGSKDTSFNTGTGFNAEVHTIQLQTDGKILVGGLFTSYIGLTENYIIRLNTDGSKDTSFNIGTGFNNSVFAIQQQTDGKILVGGDFNSYKGVTEKYIIRLNADGSKDTSFNTGTGFDFAVTTIQQQTDGKILVGGNFYLYNGVGANNIIRLNTDSSKDTSFNIGPGFNNLVYSTQQQTDGKILVGGNFTSYKGVAEKYIIRLNADGSKDTSFNTGTGFNEGVQTIQLQTDGKILVGGNFTSYKGVTEKYIIRLNADGSKDTSFNTGTGFNNIVYSIQQQTDGKILVGGEFTAYNSAIASEKRIIRLNTDGSKDTSFNTGTGFNAVVFTIQQQPDGKILVGGRFISYKGVTENAIIRLNADGSKDTSFNTGTGFNGEVRAIQLQTDGKILVGGPFISYMGLTEGYIIRLNNDGSKDTSFNTGTGFNNSVFAILQQTNGKILVGGGYSSYKGVAENDIIRLNADGSKDISFNTGTGFFNGGVYTIQQQTDGKILVGGSFASYKGDNSSVFLIGLHSEQSLNSDDFDVANAFFVYPNPVKDILHLQLNKLSTIKSIKIYDLQGKLIIEDIDNMIHVSNLSKGMYIIKVEIQEGEFEQKFIKE
ncbi:T9SS type A sorting domain-containing protein [Flavobacterium sp.]|uniref:T9SS type A sorting domain-containing protein n=1 Tax=Flavobacterium sp. TaxID=239 RepID=UPI0040483AE1